MQWFRSRVLWGGGLILCGVLFLLGSLGILPNIDFLWGILLGLAGVFFFTLFLQDRAQWWMLIPGFALLGVGLTIIFSTVWPAIGALFSGPLILGGIGLAFLIVFFLQRDQWWAIIPAGVMITLAAVALVDTIPFGVQLPDSVTPSIFFFGLGATFAVLAMIPTKQGPLKWAWIPAGILLMLGVLILAAAENLFVYLLPVGLIAFGGYFVWRALRSREA